MTDSRERPPRDSVWGGTKSCHSARSTPRRPSSAGRVEAREGGEQLAHTEEGRVKGRSEQSVPVPGWAVVDLFCGIGGLSYGLQCAGLRVVAGLDADDTCKYAFEANTGARFVGASLEAVTAADIRTMFPEGARRILVGCAPCTPFSAYASGSKGRSDKWSLVDLFLERILEIVPEIVSMENVTRLRSFENGSVFRRFVSGLRDAGYEVVVGSLNAADYGVPQYRRRLVVLASREGPIALPTPTHSRHRTVRSAIGHLPRLRAGETDPSDPIHRSPKLSSINMRRIRAAKPGRPWTEWEDPELVAQCHKRESGASFKNVYGRMEWDRPSPTLTTGCFSFGRGRFGHPQQDRAISLREAALLQSFPPNYLFAAPEASVTFAHLGRHIGNAVPVALAMAIGHTIRSHVGENAE